MAPPSVRLGHSFSVGIPVHCVMMGRGIPSSQSIYHSKACQPEVGPVDEVAMAAIAQPAVIARGADKSVETFE